MKLAHSDNVIIMSVCFIDSDLAEVSKLCKNFIAAIKKRGSKYHLSSHLKMIGILSVKSLPSPRLYSFINPVTNLECELGVDDGVVFQKYPLIYEYLELDPRIRILIGAILYLIRCRGINKCMLLVLIYNLTAILAPGINSDSMKSFSYIIMVLYFLMFEFENPLIPCLYSLPGDCISEDCLCNHNETKSAILF